MFLYKCEIKGYEIYLNAKNKQEASYRAEFYLSDTLNHYKEGDWTITEIDMINPFNIMKDLSDGMTYYSPFKEEDEEDFQKCLVRKYEDI